jgi:hypothetical protein
MSTGPNQARAALEMLGINAHPGAPAAMLYGWLAAAAFVAMIEHDHGSEQSEMMAHHEFGDAFNGHLASAGDGEPVVAWSLALSLLGFAIPSPGIDEPMQTAAAPYAAIRLAGFCCTIMAGPDDPRGAAALAAVQDLAGRFAALTDREHVLSTARHLA